MTIGITQSVSEACHRVRELICETRRHWNLRVHQKEQFNQALMALNVIDDTALGIEAYKAISGDVEPGVRYLLTYGILEAFYLQQNAVQHLSNALGDTWNPVGDRVLKDIREIRHRSSGHPTSKKNSDGVTFHELIRSSMRHGGFEIRTWTNDSKMTDQCVDLWMLIREQEGRLARQLLRLAEWIEREDEKHRVKYSERKLGLILREPEVTEAWQTIRDGFERKDCIAMRAGLGRLQMVLRSFRDALRERGLDVGTYLGLSDDYNRCEESLGESRYLCEFVPLDTEGTSELSDYLHSARTSFVEIESWAGHIDEEYANGVTP